MTDITIAQAGTWPLYRLTLREYRAHGSDREAWNRGRTHCVHWPGHWVGECG